MGHFFLCSIYLYKAVILNLGCMLESAGKLSNACLSPIPRDSDVTGLGYGLGIKSSPKYFFQAAKIQNYRFKAIPSKYNFNSILRAHNIFFIIQFKLFQILCFK